MCIRDRYISVATWKNVMTNQSPWSIKGIKPSNRDAVKEQAFKHGLTIGAVSYTHLDVYKRQVLSFVS